MITAHRLVSRAPKAMELEQQSIPAEPAADGIVVAADSTLISAGTEVANYLALTSQPPQTAEKPYYPGYCFAGTVVAVGAHIERFRPGDRVCGHLPHASHINENRADRLNRVTRIPDGVGFRPAATAELGCISLNALRLARVQLGESVAVVGAGLIGQLAARLARLSGAWPLVVVDPLPVRRALANAHGTQLTVDPTDPSMAEQIAAAAPQGFDVVFEATGSPAAFNPAVKLAGRGGRIVLLGSTRGTVEQVDVYTDIHAKGVTLIGAHAGTAPPFPTSHDKWTEMANRELLLSLIASGELDVDDLVTQTIAPEDASVTYAKLATTAAEVLGVLIDWTSGAR